MILTMPQHTHFRDMWRQSLADRQEVKLIFLNSNTKTEGEQAELEAEHSASDDIVQCSQEDGHRWLGYKILCGLTWSALHCPHVSHVVQTDDNIELHLDTMFQVLTKVKDPALEDVIMCPFVLPFNPMSRPSNASIFGGWGYTKEEYPKDVLPEYL